MLKTNLLQLLFTFLSICSFAQLPENVLVGYWHNWENLRINAVDDRYNVICLAFAEADVNSAQDDNSVYDLEFTVSNNMHSFLQIDIPAVQNEGKKVLMSVGGANGSFDLSTTAEKNFFVSKMKDWITTYGLDGIDIDIERLVYICDYSTHSLSNPSTEIQNLIDACKELDTWFETIYSREMILTTAPEIRYTTGGMSPWATCNGFLLSFLEQLNDELDLVMVQLYNTGTNYQHPGWNGGGRTEYSSGTEDFIITQTEALIKGFTPSNSYVSGSFSGFPASKVAVALPANNCSAGSGYVSSSNMISAVNYLRGTGPKPGSYTLSNSYPNLRGLMTWSINNDQKSGGCYGTSYEFADAYEEIFGVSNSAYSVESIKQMNVYPNPNIGVFTIQSNEDIGTKILISDMSGRLVYNATLNSTSINVDLSTLTSGLYTIRIGQEYATVVIK